MAISQITVFCFYEPVLSFDSQAVRQAANPLVVLSPNDQQNYEVSRSMMARRSLGVAAKARRTLSHCIVTYYADVHRCRNAPNVERRALAPPHHASA